MNKLTRLTALLLAMLMMFSTFATAETAYQVGGMTVENWQGIVDSAVERLNREIEGGDVYPLPPPPVIDSQPYAETHEVKLSEGSFTMSKADLAIVVSEQSGWWQIAVGETVNDQNETVYLWANLAGETGNFLNVNYTMLQNFPYCTIRQVNYDADNQLVQVGMLTFTLTEPTAVMMLNAVAREGETTIETGDVASETTTTPWSFERSNDDRLSDIVITYMFDDTAMPVSLRKTKAADDDGIESCVIGGRETNSVANRKIPGYMVSYAVVDGTRVEVGGKIGTDTDNITITQDNVALNGYTIPENDVEIVVYYTSAVVAYTVKSWFEPLNGGSHVQDLDNYPNKTISDNSAALTGHQLKITPDAVPGYQVLYFDEPILAANGTTSVNVYYNRSWYLMNFDLDGGYGVDPIYAKFGAAIEVPVDDKKPTKPGYVFLGWDGNGDDVADRMPTKMPGSNTTYKALWQMEPVTTVTIVYWAENADDEKYSYQSSEVTRVASGESFTYKTGLTCPLEENHEHSDNCNLVCKDEAHTHDAGCYEFTCDVVQTHTHTEQCYGSCTHSTHDKTCYTSSNGGELQQSSWAPNEDWGTLTEVGNGIWTLTMQYGYQQSVMYYVKIGDTWYTPGWNSNATITYNCRHSHDDNCLSCNETVHVHTDYMGNCYTKTCTKSVHVHGETCYDCGYVEHTHDEVCTVAGPGTQLLNTTLYTYKEADTVTSVNPDGSSVVNVYYDRVEYTVGFYSDQNCSNNKEYTSLRITAKWGAKILDKWPTYNGSASWLVQGKNNTWQNSIQVMPVGGAKFWGPKTGNNSYKAYYYVEALPGDTDTITYNGVTYKLHHTDVSVSSGNVTDEERYGIDGFTYKEGTANGTSYSNAKFYYTRNSYNLVFNNGEVDKRTDSVKFEAPLGAYADYKLTAADAPSQYEPGSMEFAGWYLNPECSDDAKVEFTNALKMPSTNVIVYAKWVPVEHDVTFYRWEEDAAKHGTENAVTPLTETFQVTHNELVPVANIPVTDPESDDRITPPEGMVGYEFDGWFYKDGDEEKPYTKEMPVTQDLVVYAKWKTTQVANFTVRYVYKDANGNEIEVAAPLEGKTIVGQNMTFDAKTGVDLYEEYRTKYFPTLYSSAITINADASKNVHTFYYTHRESVDYTVYYVEVSAYEETENGTVSITLADPTKPYIMDPRPLKTASSFVSADFVPVVGYVAADGVYHKTLNVVADAPSFDKNGNYIADTYNAKEDKGEHENIIVFYYFNDPTQSPYTIMHMLQNQDLSGYTEAEDDTIQRTGKNGTEYGDNLNVYANYEYVRAEVEYYDADKNKITAPLTLQTAEGRTWDISYKLPDNGLGMTIRIYYDLTVGDLSITKNVDNATGFVPMQDKFKITVELKDSSGNAYTQDVKYQIGEGEEVEATLTNGKFTVQLGAGATVLIKNLLHGTTYTVTEEPVTGFATTITTTQDNNVSGAIDAGNTDTVEVKNTYKVGTLNVIKKVDGTVTTDYPSNFGFTLELKDANDVAVTPNIQINGVAATATNGKYTFSLTDGGTATITGIPQGVTYTVAENVQAGYFEVSATNATGKMAADGNVKAEFTNTPLTGSLTISKTIKGNGANGSDTFLFDVTGPNGYQTTVVLTAGKEITLTNLPFGDYTVTENTAWSWRYTISGQKSQICDVVPGTVPAADFTNERTENKWLDGEVTDDNTFN